MHAKKILQRGSIEFDKEEFGETLKVVNSSNSMIRDCNSTYVRSKNLLKLFGRVATRV